MEEHFVKILKVEYVTHNVRRFTIEKPEGYIFTPGQATDVAINKPGYESELRPFTFTALNEWENLEFTIKIYKDHNGVTNKLSELQPGDELIIHDVWGSIEYKGPGTFIAGGAGITPFIAILRSLKSKNELMNNKLIFANNRKEDIILESEFNNILGTNFINILACEKINGYAYGHINERFLEENILGKDKMFYLCGPPPMMDSVEKQLGTLGIDPKLIVKEGF